MDARTKPVCIGQNEDGSPCGEELELDSQFCPMCGVDVKFCPQCQKVLPNRPVNFCPKCRYRLRPAGDATGLSLPSTIGRMTGHHTTSAESSVSFVILDEENEVVRPMVHDRQNDQASMPPLHLSSARFQLGLASNLSQSEQLASSQHPHPHGVPCGGISGEATPPNDQLPLQGNRTQIRTDLQDIDISSLWSSDWAERVQAYVDPLGQRHPDSLQHGHSSTHSQTESEPSNNENQNSAEHVRTDLQDIELVSVRSTGRDERGHPTEQRHPDSLQHGHSSTHSQTESEPSNNENQNSAEHVRTDLQDIELVSVRSTGRDERGRPYYVEPRGHMEPNHPDSSHSGHSQNQSEHSIALLSVMSTSRTPQVDLKLRMESRPTPEDYQPSPPLQTESEPFDNDNSNGDLTIRVPLDLEDVNRWSVQSTGRDEHGRSIVHLSFQVDVPLTEDTSQTPERQGSSSENFLRVQGDMESLSLSFPTIDNLVGHPGNLTNCEDERKESPVEGQGSVQGGDFHRNGPNRDAQCQRSSHSSNAGSVSPGHNVRKRLGEDASHGEPSIGEQGEAIHTQEPAQKSGGELVMRTNTGTEEERIPKYTIATVFNVECQPVVAVIHDESDGGDNKEKCEQKKSPEKSEMEETEEGKGENAQEDEAGPRIVLKQKEPKEEQKSEQTDRPVEKKRDNEETSDQFAKAKMAARDNATLGCADGTREGASLEDFVRVAKEMDILENQVTMNTAKEGQGIPEQVITSNSSLVKVEDKQEVTVKPNETEEDGRKEKEKNVKVVCIEKDGKQETEKTIKAEKKHEAEAVTIPEQEELNKVEYDKKLKEPAVHLQPSSGKTNQSTGQSMVTRQQARWKATLTLRFQVIVSPDFKYSKKDTRILVVFKTRELQEGEMQMIRRFADDSVLMSCDVEFEKHWLNFSHYREYEYICVKDQGKFYHEQYYCVGKCRSFTIRPEDRENPGVIYQYDGYMMRDPRDLGTGKRIAAWIASSYDRDRILVEKALKEMLPNWESLQQASHYLSHVERVYTCLTDWTLLPDNHHAQRACFQGAIQQLVLDTLSDLKGRQREGMERLPRLMCVLFICERYDVKLSEKTHSYLLEVLLVTPQNYMEVDKLYTMHFTPEKHNLGACVRRFFSRGVERYPDNIHILNVVPLMHFLNENSQPYGTPKECQSNRHEDGSWWGIAGIKKDIDVLKKHLDVKPTERVIAYLEEVRDVFIIDLLFPRTFLAALSAKHIDDVAAFPEVPLNGLLAMVSYHIKMKDIPFYDVQKVLASIRGRVIAEEPHIHGGPQNKKNDSQLVVTWDITCGIGFDVLSHIMDQSVNYVFPYQNVIDAVNILEMIFRTERKLRKEFRDTYGMDAPKPSNSGLLTEIVNLVATWVNKYIDFLELEHCYTVITKRQNEIEVWSGLLNVKLSGDRESDTWHGTIVRELEQRTKNIKSEDLVSIFIYNVKQKEHNPTLVEHFSECALQVAEEKWKEGTHLFEHGSGDNVVSLLQQLLLKNWPKNDQMDFVDDEDEVIEHVLKTPSFHRYLEIYRSNTIIMRPKCNDILKNSIYILSVILQQLETGDVTLQKLSHVNQNPESFVSCVISADLFTRETPNEESLHQLIELRQNEMEDFNNNRNHVRMLRVLCGKIDHVDTRIIDGRLDNDVWQATLNETENCHQEQGEKTYGFFQLPVEYKEILPKLQEFQDRWVFHKIWKLAGHDLAWRMGRRNDPGTLSLRDVAKSIWPVTCGRWNSLKNRIYDGSVTLEEVDKFLMNLSERHLNEELNAMLPPESDGIVTERIQQLGRYKRIWRYQQAAQEMIAARDDLKLTGDFSPMERICPHSKLSTMTAEVIQDGKVLDSMQAEHIKAIKIFRLSVPLVDWLHKYVPSLEDLKRLVASRLIAATGQGDVEVTKLVILNNVIHGFAPLIYGLPKTAGFEDFFKQCQEVWPALQKDPALPTKLAEVNKDLDWLKQLKDTGEHI